MKKILILLFCVAILTQCNPKGTKQSTQDSSQTIAQTGENAPNINAGSSGNIEIGIAMPESHVHRWIKDGNTLLAQAQARGYSADHKNAHLDQAVQNQHIQDFLSRGAKGLIIGTINETANPAIENARRGGAKIIAYDRIIQGTNNYDCYITYNNYAVGTLQGQAIVEGINLDSATAANPKYITLFAGAPTDGNANFFFQGAIDVLLPYIQKNVLKVVGPAPRSYRDAAFQQIATENWNPVLAKVRMENLLKSDEFSNIILDAVLAPNDTLGLAIIEALKADAKYQSKLPLVTGQDAQIDGLVSIQNGELYVTVFKDTNKLAEAAIQIMDQLLKGQPVSVPGVTLASGDFREIGNTRAGYVTTYLLTPISITKNNVRLPVEAGFITEEEAKQLN